VKGRLSWPIFWALVGIFIVIVSVFSIPAFRDLVMGFLFIIISGTVFLLLGGALIVLTVREKVGGMLKKFFLLTGASSTGVFVFVLLHNLVYGLFIHFFGAGFWDRIGLGDEPFFFIMATLVCPLGFLVGAVGSIWLWSVLEPKDVMNAKGAEIPTAWLSIIPIAGYIWWWRFCKGVDMISEGRMSAPGAFCLVFFLGIIGTVIIRIIMRSALHNVAPDIAPSPVSS